MAGIAVRIRLFASLRRYQPKGTDGPIPLVLPAGATVRDAAAALGIPEKSAGIVVCNDVHLELGSPLQDGTEVSIFPPLAGGADDEVACGDLAIVASGAVVGHALEAAPRLAAGGVEAAVLNVHTLKPIDAALLEEWGARTGGILTVEDHGVVGGLGSAVCEALSETGIPVRVHGVRAFGESGTGEALYAKHGLDAPGIEAAALRVLAERGVGRSARARRSG